MLNSAWASVVFMRSADVAQRSSVSVGDLEREQQIVISLPDSRSSSDST
jgi:hypothetical protein